MNPIREVQLALTSRGEQLTLEEEDLLMNFSSRLRRIYKAGFLVGSVATFLVCRRLNPPPISWRAFWAKPSLYLDNMFFSAREKINYAIAFCSGVVCGGFPAMIYLESSLHHMLSLNGSLIQRELASTMLKPEHDHPWFREIVSKHLIPEVVYTESSADGKPIIRWHFKGEDFISPASETNVKDSIIKSTPTNQVKAEAAVVASKSPFDSLLGVAESAEDEVEPNPNTPEEKSRRQTTKERRRSRRGHRHHGNESNATQ